MTSKRELIQQVRMTDSLNHNVMLLGEYLKIAWGSNFPVGIGRDHIVTLATTLWAEGVLLNIPTELMELDEDDDLDAPHFSDVKRAEWINSSHPSTFLDLLTEDDDEEEL